MDTTVTRYKQAHTYALRPSLHYIDTVKMSSYHWPDASAHVLAGGDVNGAAYNWHTVEMTLRDFL
jgi:hypothetical protein